MWFPSKMLYSKVTRDEEAQDSFWQSNARSRRLQGLTLLATGFVAGVLGAFASKGFTTLLATPGEPQLESNLWTFSYNRSFSYPPSSLTDSAWSALFPGSGGFFNHPNLPNTRSTLAVLHQLHCLDGFRRGYWANNEAAMKGQVLVDKDLPHHLQSSHIRHCIDLLRQTLMCHGDTTIEIVDEDLGGVTGFGTEHHCKNWEELKEWVVERQKKDALE